MEIAMDYSDCVLRHAAGTYWIVRVKQERGKYVRPVHTNESGAWMFERLSQGMTVEEVASGMAREFGIDVETALLDARDFVRQLGEYM
jgi:hypothetical protein